MATEVSVEKRAFAVTVGASTDLDVPAERAWKVLTDTERYPQWNPFVTRLEGALTLGERLRVVLCLPGRKPQEMRPRLVDVEPGRSFTWLGSVGVRGVFDGRHHFEVIPVDDGHSRLVQSERLSGLLVPLFKPMLTGPTPAAFVALNDALAERVRDA
ncbi:MAG TPA: SRPBCC domain-containing protein [Acidimicrobiales bacterium]|nr:SRPBCC domain-containing protein [Acidimicrobiales bacterium]